MARVVSATVLCLLLAAMFVLAAGVSADLCYRVGAPVPAGQPC